MFSFCTEYYRDSISLHVLFQVFVADNLLFQLVFRRFLSGISWDKSEVSPTFRSNWVLTSLVTNLPSSSNNTTAEHRHIWVSWSAGSQWYDCGWMFTRLRRHYACPGTTVMCLESPRMIPHTVSYVVILKWNCVVKWPKNTVSPCLAVNAAKPMGVVRDGTRMTTRLLIAKPVQGLPFLDSSTYWRRLAHTCSQNFQWT